MYEDKSSYCKFSPRAVPGSDQVLAEVSFDFRQDPEYLTRLSQIDGRYPVHCSDMFLIAILDNSQLIVCLQLIHNRTYCLVRKRGGLEVQSAQFSDVRKDFILFQAGHRNFMAFPGMYECPPHGQLHCRRG